MVYTSLIYSLYIYIYIPLIKLVNMGVTDPIALLTLPSGYLT